MSSLPLVARGATHHRLHRRRSRNGCSTCKRRKVRCDEQRPRCYHCNRLNLECVWKAKVPQPPSPPKNAVAGDPPESNVVPLEVDWPSPPADLFDFTQSVTDPTEGISLFQDIYLPDLGDSTALGHTLHEFVQSTDLDEPSSPLGSARSPAQSLIANVDVEDSLLLHAPPILDPIENGPICASLRALFDSMATSSPMVRYSIAAFAAIQLYTTGKRVDYQQYYDKAANELSETFHKSRGSMTVDNKELRYVLTTIFFLTYINVCPLDSECVYFGSR